MSAKKYVEQKKKKMTFENVQNNASPYTGGLRDTHSKKQKTKTEVPVTKI